jgi:type IV secretory pathway TrbL component
MSSASVASSAASNCGGPMQQYYNSNCGDNGQQSYMHMTQSQSMTFSQQRARLLSAGASPTNIRPPTNVQQSNLNNEHHMLPQHMNRAPVNIFIITTCIHVFKILIINIVNICLKM